MTNSCPTRRSSDLVAGSGPAPVAPTRSGHAHARGDAERLSPIPGGPPALAGDAECPCVGMAGGFPGKRIEGAGLATVPPLCYVRRWRAAVLKETGRASCRESVCQYV